MRVEVGAFVFEVSYGVAAEKIPRSRIAWRSGIGTFASAVFHLALLFAFARLLPTLDGGVDGEAPVVEMAYTSFPGFVSVTAEPELAMPDADALGAVPRRGTDLGGVDGGARPLGAPKAPHARLRYGVDGPADNPDPHIARRDAGDGEIRFSFVPGDGPPRPAGGDLHAPLAPWGRDDSLGNDPTSARGEMWGDEIDESFGAAGLGLAGDAECGCGSVRALARGETRDLLRIVRAIDMPTFEIAASAPGARPRCCAPRALNRPR